MGKIDVRFKEKHEIAISDLMTIKAFGSKAEAVRHMVEGWADYTTWKSIQLDNMVKMMDEAGIEPHDITKRWNEVKG